MLPHPNRRLNRRSHFRSAPRRMRSECRCPCTAIPTTSRRSRKTISGACKRNWGIGRLCNLGRGRAQTLPAQFSGLQDRIGKLSTFPVAKFPNYPIIPMLLKLTILPGDGIGPEVTEQAVLVLKAVAEGFGHPLQL